MARQKIDPSDLDHLLTLWSDGASASEIAGILGITRNAVIGYVQRARAKGDVRALVGMQKAPPPAKSLDRVLTRKPASKGGAELCREKRAANHKMQQSQIVSSAGQAMLSAPPAPVPLVDCRPGCCRWPVSRDERGHLFCDAPVEAGQRPQWCAEHRAIGFSARAA